MWLLLIIICFLVLLIAYEFNFWKTHQRPLTSEEILKLSKIRQIKYINKFFHFSRQQFNINPSFRSHLDQSGRWDKISLPVSATASFLTALLKYKRHEWWVMVLADEYTAKLIWANKGLNNESCYFKGDYETLLNLAKKYNCNTIISMHNHPHTSDRYWNLLHPSETDLKTAKKLKSLFKNEKMNLIESLCSQGDFIVYDYMFSSPFPNTSIKEISAENNISENNNYKLHCEIRNGKNLKVNL
ncbi:MAG: hypothetical protein J6B80_01865 [Clostridia bacterium]|nr:hypothetical protein [Clostridia bacterium]